MKLNNISIPFLLFHRLYLTSQKCSKCGIGLGHHILESDILSFHGDNYILCSDCRSDLQAKIEGMDDQRNRMKQIKQEFVDSLKQQR